MKYIIAVDLEGLACVVGAPGQTLNESSNYEFACRQAVREVNAAAKALFETGAEQVLVWDNHGSGVNLEYANLDTRCDIILGSGAPHRWPGLDDSFAGLLMIGYHAKDNTENGVLCHTYNSKMYQWIKINDVEVGEIEIDAAMAGECFGVPVIFVSSDDKGIQEAWKFIPWAETVITKTGLSRTMAISKHPLRVTDEITEGVKRAVANLDLMKRIVYDSPITEQRRFKRIEDAESAMRNNPSAVRVDAYTVEQTFEKLSDVY